METRQALLRVDPADGWLAALLKNRRKADNFQRVKRLQSFRPTKITERIDLFSARMACTRHGRAHG
jgi:hypothetical protein